MHVYVGTIDDFLASTSGSWSEGTTFCCATKHHLVSRAAARGHSQNYSSSWQVTGLPINERTSLTNYSRSLIVFGCFKKHAPGLRLRVVALGSFIPLFQFGNPPGIRHGTLCQPIKIHTRIKVKLFSKQHANLTAERNGDRLSGIIEQGVLLEERLVHHCRFTLAFC